MKRLNDNHPTMKKFNELCDKAHALGLSLTFNSYGVCSLQDEAYPNTTFYVRDLDQSETPCEEFPPTLDFKIVRDE